jgi:hypothetical protein
MFQQHIFSVTWLTVNSTTGTKFVRLKWRFIETKGFSLHQIMFFWRFALLV